MGRGTELMRYMVFPFRHGLFARVTVNVMQVSSCSEYVSVRWKSNTWGVKCTRRYTFIRQAHPRTYIYLMPVHLIPHIPPHAVIPTMRLRNRLSIHLGRADTALRKVARLVEPASSSHRR